MRDRTRVLLSCSLGLGLALALATTGCAGLKVHVRYDGLARFDEYKTFDWIPKADDQNTPTGLEPAFRAKVRKVLARLMIEKGYERASQGTPPDVYIVFYDHFDNPAQPWLSSWGRPYHPWYVNPWGYSWDDWLEGWRPSATAGQAEIGTMVIDVVDAKTHKLVWRGWGRGAVDPKATEEDLLRYAGDIMERFPSDQLDAVEQDDTQPAWKD